MPRRKSSVDHKNTDSNSSDDNESIQKSSRSGSKQTNSDDTLKRLAEFAKRQKEIEQHEKNKQQANEYIKNAGGFTFDQNAQIKSTPNSNQTSLELAPEQIELIDRWCSNTDPLIPIQPKLDNLFNYEFKNISSVGDNFILKNGLLDIHNFTRYFSQIKTQEEKENLLNLLLYQATATTADFRNTIACDILTFILTQNKDKNLKWKVTSIQFFDILCNLGLNTDKFNAKCSHLIEYIKDNCENNEYLMNQLSSKGESKEIQQKDWRLFDMILENLANIMTLSFIKQKPFYDENELDFLFCLITYALLDINISNSQLELPFKQLLSELLDSYDSNIWSNKKHELCENLICMNGDNHYCIIYLNDYFEQTDKERSIELAYEIAMVLSLNLMDFNIEQIEDIKSNQMNILLNLFKINGAEIYTHSSLKMYIIIKCIELIINELITKKHPNAFDFLNELKDTLSSIIKHVRDKVELQGRHQVKVKITNLIGICDYHLNLSDRWKLKLINNDLLDVTINSTVRDLNTNTNTMNIDDSNILETSLLPNIV